MTDGVLSDAEVEKMETPVWTQAKAAIDAGDLDGAKVLIDRAVQQWAGLKDYSINWITSLLTFVADELGEAAVERALRKTGDEFVRPRRNSEIDWGAVPAAQRAKVIARAMLGNMGEVEVSEDEEKIILAFRCGSGGRLIDDGRYEGEHPYRTLREAAGRTFSRDELPVYCAHCSVNNEIQPVEWGSTPTSIEYPPERPGERCIHHVYKDVDAVPDEAYVRIGKLPPRSPR
jgi:hypothetical protein